MTEEKGMKGKFDPEAVISEMGGEEELLKEIAEMFLSMYPEDLESINRAIESGNSEDIRSSAHRMKGSVANFGKNDAYQAARRMEETARAGELDEMGKLYEDLSTELGCLDQELRDYLGNEN